MPHLRHHTIRNAASHVAPQNGDRGSREPRGLWGCAPLGEAAASCVQAPRTWSVLGFWPPRSLPRAETSAPAGLALAGVGGHYGPVCRVGGPPKSGCVDSLAAHRGWQQGLLGWGTARVHCRVHLGEGPGQGVPRAQKESQFQRRWGHSEPQTALHSQLLGAPGRRPWM